MAIHSSILVWKIPWTEEPGEPQSQSMALQRIELNSRNIKEVIIFQSILTTPPSCSLPLILFLIQFLKVCLFSYFLPHYQQLSPSVILQVFSATCMFLNMLISAI